MESQSLLLLCDEAVMPCTPRDCHIDYNLEVSAQVDRVLVQDDRVIKNMLADEKMVEKIDYCASLQTEIKPHMRKIVVDWMVEVCQDQECQPQVFHLALNYLDRFLSQKRIKKTQFQLLATVCLFLASKMSECAPITAEKLLIYTDNSVSFEELIQWEMLVLATLLWELSAITPLSFLQHFQNANCVRKLSQDHETVQRHADYLLSIMASEYQYLLVAPSLLAAAALSAAVRVQCRGSSNERRSLEQLTKSLSELTGRSGKEIELVAGSVQDLLDCYQELLNFKSKMQENGSMVNCEEYCIV